MTTGALESVQISSNQLGMHMKRGKGCWIIEQIHGHPFIQIPEHLMCYVQNSLQVYLMHPTSTVGLTCSVDYNSVSTVFGLMAVAYFTSGSICYA
jgi:hypothetical protein